MPDLNDPFDLVRFYMPQSSLDSLAYERGLRRVDGLRLPEPGIKDSVMHGLATALVGSMSRPIEAQPMFVEHIALAFHAHVAHAYGGAPESGHYSGGLTLKQLRRACDIMQSTLNGKHSVARLAAECGLSSSHFAKAFKEATGLAPYRWLMHKRIQRACELLTQTQLELADIAVICGFVDQSHFSRVFVKFMKQSPGRWRRQRM